MSTLTDDIFAPGFAVLKDLFNNKISASQAAKNLASMSLPAEPETELNRLWALIQDCAYKFPEHHDKLVDVLILLSKLPSPKTADGTQL